MSNRTLLKAYSAGAAVAAHRIIKWGAADRAVIQAAAAADSAIGVSDRLSAASGERIDIVRAGIADVEYGDAVARGALLTSDADGKAVTAAAGNRVIGVAEISGVAGDIGEVLISPGLH